MDRKTAAFYLTLAGLVVLDVILLVWIFTPLGHYGAGTTTVVYAATVNEHPKPSSFDYYATKNNGAANLGRSRLLAGGVTPK